MFDADFKLCFGNFQKKASVLLVAYGVLFRFFWCSDKVFRTLTTVGVGPTVSMCLLRNICNELECYMKLFSLVIVILVVVRYTNLGSNISHLSVNCIASNSFLS